MSKYFEYDNIGNGSLEDVTLYRSPYSDGVSNNSHSGLGRGSVIEEVDPPNLVSSGIDYPDDTVMSTIDRSKTTSILPTEWSTQIDRHRPPNSFRRREHFEMDSSLFYIIIAICVIIAAYFLYNKYYGGGYRRFMPYRFRSL
jgi:hypothetical protein